jgi:hypothetical protein
MEDGDLSELAIQNVKTRNPCCKDLQLSRYIQFNKSHVHNPARFLLARFTSFFPRTVHASRSEELLGEPSMYKIETSRCTRQSNVMSVFRVSPREHPSRYAHHEEALEVVNTPVSSSIRAATRNTASHSIAHHHGYPDRDSRTIGDYWASRASARFARGTTLFRIGRLPAHLGIAALRRIFLTETIIQVRPLGLIIDCVIPESEQMSDTDGNVVAKTSCAPIMLACNKYRSFLMDPKPLTMASGRLMRAS